MRSLVVVAVSLDNALSLAEYQLVRVSQMDGTRIYPAIPRTGTNSFNYFILFLNSI